MNFVILLSSLLLSVSGYTDTSSVYQLNFNDIDGSIVNMSSYVGKQIIVYEFNAASPDKGQMIALDSLVKSRSNLAVIAIPVQDFDSTAISEDSLRTLLKDSFQLSYLVTDISNAKKSDSASQHPLLDWMTHVEKNMHFDDDIVADGYMFVISDAGILYSILKKEFSPTGTMMQQILGNQPSPDN